MKRASGLILIIILIHSHSCTAQSDSLAFSKDFIFKEGLYPTWNDFRNNNPVPESKIITYYDKTASDFMSKELQKAEITYLASDSTEQKITTNKLWGYCSNNQVFINYGKEFTRVMVIGSICHFTAYTEIYLGGYEHYNNAPSNMRGGYEQEQLIIDMRSGKVGAFNVVNMEVLLKQDDAIYNEFMALKKRKKKQLIFSI